MFLENYIKEVWYTVTDIKGRGIYYFLCCRPKLKLKIQKTHTMKGQTWYKVTVSDL